jgi:hypothetical protein
VKRNGCVDRRKRPTRQEPSACGLYVFMYDLLYDMTYK